MGERHVGKAEQARELEMPVRDVAHDGAHALQLGNAFPLIAALEQHLRERQPAERLEIRAADFDRQAHRGLLHLQRAHQILAQHRLPALEVVIEDLREPPRLRRERRQLLGDRRRRLEVARAERGAIAVHEELERPRMDAGGARDLEAFAHRLQSRLVLGGEHAVHGRHVLERDARERRHAARGGGAARLLDKLCGARVEARPHERQRAEHPDRHLQIGLGRMARGAERALDPLLDIGALRLAQREGEHHARGDARFDRRRANAGARRRSFVEHRDPAVEQRQVVELVEDRIHGASRGEDHAVGVALAACAEELEGALVRETRLARRELRLARRRPVDRPGIALEELGRQVLDPVAQRLAAALLEHRRALCFDQPRHLVPVVAFAVERERIVAAPRLRRERRGASLQPPPQVLRQRLLGAREQELAEHRVVLVERLGTRLAQGDEIVVAMQAVEYRGSQAPEVRR